MSKRRENGFGTLISKGEGKPFMAKWFYQGKCYYKSTGEVDKKKALKALEIITKPFREDSKIDVLLNLEAKVKSAEEEKRRNELRKEGIKLIDLEDKIDCLLEFKEVTDSTKTLYKGFIKKFVEWVKDNKKLDEMKHISPKIAKEYMLYVSDFASPASYNQRLVLFKRLWELLKDEGRYEINVFKDLKKMKVEKSSKRAFTTEEIFMILDYIKDDLDMVCLFSLGIYTGLRLGDCACLQWSNVDLIKRTISIVPQKVKRYVKEPIVIPIHNSLYNVLMNVRENKKSDEFVLPEFRKSYETKYLKNKILKIFQDCGIKTYQMENGRKKFLCGFHSLRHTFVSMNINSGMNPMLVQNIVGHSSVDMTRNYFHQNEIVLRDGINNMPDFIECKDYVDMSIKDGDLELLRSMFDKDKDKSLSDTIKRLVDSYKEIINIE
jgi:integrase